eukprot:CAMPEP_0178831032 /NCGR_PEP_ID=MMETSP0746-20121128/9241_1 /TAXON_ID=913974 /ORGANISM="Nitzschia punctata, Strain CCMP561" /LENGTH=89 /DNA_ID=CAMNT_0020493241 /DNA_START=371 /DNA_END=641 /DNA_ORIENTATION=+
MVPKFLDRGSLGLFLGGGGGTGRGGGGGGRGGGGGTLTPNLEEDGMEDGLEEEAEAGQTEGLTYCPGDYVLEPPFIYRLESALSIVPAK